MNRADLAEHLAGRIEEALDRGRTSDRAAFLGGRVINEAVTSALSGPNLLGRHYQAVNAALVGALQAGMTPRRAAKQAIEQAFQGEDEHAAQPDARARTVAQLAARYASALSAGHDPDRAARVAAGGMPGMNGVGQHLAIAARDGLDPQATAEAAYDSFFRGGGQRFGDALLDRGGNRPRPAERQSVRRTWDALAPHERMIVASYQAEQGRGGQEPSSRDITAALSSLSHN